MIKRGSFEALIKARFQPYLGMTYTQICERLGLFPKGKNKFDKITREILGVKTHTIEEFEKGSILLRTIRLKENGVPKESLSFPYFKYIDIINEEWESSTLKNQFLDKKFFFVIYQYIQKTPKEQYSDDFLILKDTMFWDMPFDDLEEAKRVWEETKLRIRQDKCNNLPQITESSVLHVRPHAKNKRDTCITPSGKHVVKKSFWLNASYLKTQIERD
jgi:DNA mismatch repair protein MutH